MTHPQDARAGAADVPAEAVLRTFPPRRNPGTMVAWAVIVAIVAFVAVRNWTAAHTPAAGRAADEVNLLMSSRMAVGYHALFHSGDESHDKNTLQFTSQISASALSPRQKLESAAVIGELEGAAAAIDQLDFVHSFLTTSSQREDERDLRTIYGKGVGGLSESQRDRLAHELGWFGKLGLSFGVPASQPPRSSIIAAGLRTFFAAIGMELLVFVLLATGVAVFTVAAVRIADGKLRLAYHPPQSNAGPFLEAFALYIAGYIGLAALIHRYYHGPPWGAYLIVLAWIVLACCWPLARGVRWAQLRQGLGWHAGRGLFREAGAGILGYLAGIPAVALGLYATVALMKASGERATHPIVFEAGTDLRTILGLYLLASVFAPVVEETMFRGALFHHLRGRHRWAVSAGLSALIFAAVHPQGWAAIPILGAIGFVFAGIREWRSSAVASATAHALHNAIATTVLILTLG